MKPVLSIIMILAFVLFPFAPMDAYAKDDPELLLTIVVATVGAIVFLAYAPELFFNEEEQEQKKFLIEQFKQLEPIENIGPQNNFTPTENANVHGAMYPVFEW